MIVRPLGTPAVILVVTLDHIICGPGELTKNCNTNPPVAVYSFYLRFLQFLSEICSNFNIKFSKMFLKVSANFIKY